MLYRSIFFSLSSNSFMIQVIIQTLQLCMWIWVDKHLQGKKDMTILFQIALLLFWITVIKIKAGLLSKEFRILDLILSQVAIKILMMKIYVKMRMEKGVRSHDIGTIYTHRKTCYMSCLLIRFYPPIRVELIILRTGIDRPLCANKMLAAARLKRKLLIHAKWNNRLKSPSENQN